MNGLKFNLKLPPSAAKPAQPAENKPATSSGNGWGKALGGNGQNGFKLNIKFGKGATENKNNFPEFNFGTGQTFQSSKDPKEKFETTVLGAIGKNTAAQGNNEEGGDDAQNIVSINADEFAGEEDDQNLLNRKCKLLVLTPPTDAGGKAAWTERASGPFHLNKTKDAHRIVIRREPLLQPVVNTLVGEYLKPKLNKSTIQCCFILDNKPTPATIRFKDSTIAKEVFDKLTEIIDNLKK
ncbi:hypothetical protein TVAG_055960 [Trichomonas vaginalis G3]|uniref:RanBD1 domain-containing protein n=1 Tax=Trichomonas vaginalis (strain ATCC PRA-98 / G3) TaxID=412133 RepID=A2EL49_TRIV3|nr:Ran binding protein family [Trichomonas vaginalis G3]EAY06602.1 hypothetical protein TVAG_055960 [Trichomonas vaginalis G3]KAI5551644.1 Ran binding protein family [Trichomonas vaginalis G3]|eukprot:XP_001318825.1 hypothetical protein [Trichomonas vaginalis G3]